MRTLRSVLATLRAAVAEARANPGSFWTQVVTMAVNDLAWVAFWVIVFRKVGTIRGWDRDRILLLFAVLTTDAGFVLGVLANTKRIPEMVRDGELDAALTLPTPTLPHLLVRRVDAVNIGDCVFGVVLFLTLGHPTVGRTLVYVFGSLTGAAVMAGFLVAIGSLALFTGRGEPGELGLHAIILLSSYPVDIFVGATKILLYTAVPAAFVSAVPARLIDHVDGGQAASMAGMAVALPLVGWTVFTLGLRRYTSSSLWTRA